MGMPGLSDLMARVGRTPMTDPRSLGGSMLFHALLVVLLSAAALSAVGQAEPDAPRAIRAELDPVDNRAKGPNEGGGAPGELSVTQLASALANVAPPSATATAPEAAPTRDPAADALLSEILPAAPPSEAVRQALPGPQTSSLTAVAVPGAAGGGGGGSGGGTGGGVGRGVGPGTEFFGARDHATSFAYVIDCSGSMASRGSLDVAKRELTASLGQLPPDARFSVVFYNLHAIMFSDPQGRQGLMAATAGNKARVGQQLAQVVPDGGTDHMLALRSALTLRPEVIFFLTDADLMTNSDVSALLKEAGNTRIQAVEFGRGMELDVPTNPLRRLATSTGGTYRYIDVTRFPRR